MFIIGLTFSSFLQPPRRRRRRRRRRNRRRRIYNYQSYDLDDED
jgi:hypothetical protein